MNNTFLGIEAIARGLSFTVKNIMQYQLIWGFGFGFFIASIIHCFIISDNSRHFPSLLFSDHGTAFTKIFSNKRLKDGTYTISFSSFVKLADKSRMFFSASLFIFLFIILLAVLKF